MLSVSYLNGCSWCKKNAKVVIFSGHTCHCVTNQVVGEWGVSGAGLLGHIPALIWKQEEVWTTWLLRVRFFIHNTWVQRLGHSVLAHSEASTGTISKHFNRMSDTHYVECFHLQYLIFSLNYHLTTKKRLTISLKFSKKRVNDGLKVIDSLLWSIWH